MIDHETLAITIGRACADRRLRRGVHAVHRYIERHVRQRGAACGACGRCCRFDEYGHVLFTTTLELAVFAADARMYEAAARAVVPMAGWPACPFLRQGRCGVHDVRPAGCRIFFCADSGGNWQQELYRRCHQHIRRLHERLFVPYAYFEWRAGLNALRGVQNFRALV